MIINDKAELNEFAVKITESINKALLKMAKTAAANNQDLIIGNQDGSFKSIPAKELLKTITK